MIFHLADMKYERELAAKSRFIQSEVGKIICRMGNRGILISSLTVRELFLLLDSNFRELIQKRIQYDIEAAKANMAEITKNDIGTRLDQALSHTYQSIVVPIMSIKAIERLHSHLVECFDKMIESVRVEAYRDLDIAITEIECDQ